MSSKRGYKPLLEVRYVSYLDLPKKVDLMELLLNDQSDTDLHSGHCLLVTHKTKVIGCYSESIPPNQMAFRSSLEWVGPLIEWAHLRGLIDRGLRVRVRKCLTFKYSDTLPQSVSGGSPSVYANGQKATYLLVYYRKDLKYWASDQAEVKQKNFREAFGWIKPFIEEVYALGNGNLFKLKKYRHSRVTDWDLPERKAPLISFK